MKTLETATEDELAEIERLLESALTGEVVVDAIVAMGFPRPVVAEFVMASREGTDIIDAG